MPGIIVVPPGGMANRGAQDQLNALQKRLSAVEQAHSGQSTVTNGKNGTNGTDGNIGLPGIPGASSAGIVTEDRATLSADVSTTYDMTLSSPLVSTTTLCYAVFLNGIIISSQYITVISATVLRIAAFGGFPLFAGQELLARYTVSGDATGEVENRSVLVSDVTTTFDFTLSEPLLMMTAICYAVYLDGILVSTQYVTVISSTVLRIAAFGGYPLYAGQELLVRYTTGA
jgi:hypothetical protein